MARRPELIVGLDVGTTKICAIVGELMPDGEIEIIGIGTNPSTGLRKGIVVNIEHTVESITRAVKGAELMAGTDIRSVYVGIAGGHIKGFNERGVIAVKDQEITAGDVERVIDTAKAVSIPLDREILHVIPLQYIIDGEDGIKDPRGMSGVRLEAEVHIVTGAVTSVQNLIKCCEKAGLEVADIVLEPIASAEATLSEDEKDLGVGIVDIGGGTTDIALFHEGSISHSAVIAIGGNHFTRDLAAGLRTPAPEAERIKHEHGSALINIVPPDEMVTVRGLSSKGGREIPRRYIAEILQPRAEELLDLIEQQISPPTGPDLTLAGLVFTGGASQLKGIQELAEQRIGLPVRSGVPRRGITGLTDIVNTPMHATGVGLLLYGAGQELGEGHATGTFKNGNLFQRIVDRMRGWMDGLIK